MLPLPLQRSWIPLRAIIAPRSPTRYHAGVKCIHAFSHESRYAEKLQEKARQQGLELSELRSRAKEAYHKDMIANLRSTSLSRSKKSPSESDGGKVPGISSTRKDSSPVKPLESFINVSRILSKPHTAEQISSLWTAYHASRTDGTGRGFICASVPVKLYAKMLNIGKQYPVFVVPVARENSLSTSPEDQESDIAHEFFFLQWNFHAPPSPPSVTEPFSCPPPGDAIALPQTATVMFTPLQEYKLRQSFATPYLVLTFYPDFAQTHGTVLLRGEITPSAATAISGQDTQTRFLLSQVDAQLLTMCVQKFYLWGDGKEYVSEGEQRAEKLLRQFHEKPDGFDWQDLLKYASFAP